MHSTHVYSRAVPSQAVKTIRGWIKSGCRVVLLANRAEGSVSKVRLSHRVYNMSTGGRLN